MELDELKTTWQAYEQKLDSTQQAGQQILQILQQNRSKNTVDKMIRELRLAGVILLALVLFFSAVIIGNAFDYTASIQYIPAVCYVVITATGLYFLMKHYRDLREVTLFAQDLRQTLLDLIELRSRHSKLMKWVWALVMLASSLVILSIVMHKFNGVDWWQTALIMLLPIGITGVSIGLASLAGMFVDRYLAELKVQVNELNEPK